MKYSFSMGWSIGKYNFLNEKENYKRFYINLPPNAPKKYISAITSLDSKFSEAEPETVEEMLNHIEKIYDNLWVATDREEVKLTIAWARNNIDVLDFMHLSNQIEKLHNSIVSLKQKKDCLSSIVDDILADSERNSFNIIEKASELNSVIVKV